MGQKVNPIGLRLGINRTWDSRWYASDKYGDLLHEDLKLRKYLFDRLSQAGVSRVVIERPAKKARVTIHSARPGVVIGKKGADIEKLRSDLSRMTGSDVHLNIIEIRKPEIDAKLVAENIAQQLERRVAFRRAMKRSVQSAMRLGAQECRLEAGSLTREIYGSEVIHERHRHRYEFNNRYLDALREAGMVFSGFSVDGLVETIELPDHPWFMASQFHPEFTSSPRDGHPVFTGFINAALQYQSQELAVAAGA